MITIIGGTYIEDCDFPHWEQIYGSGFRAVSALEKLSNNVSFHTYASKKETDFLKSKSKSMKFNLSIYEKQEPISFYYLHSLSSPYIYPHKKNIIQNTEIEVKANNVLRYGMLEGRVRVDANKAVYDPQSQDETEDFFANGSTANHLVVILNRTEANNLYNYVDEKSIVEIQSLMKQNTKIKAIIIKGGSNGALLIEPNQTYLIPVFKTKNVWKIGSGDIFSSIFAHYWAEKNLKPVEAALRASISTAYYCDTKAVPILKYNELIKYYKPLNLDFDKSDLDKKIYLAGPFFSISQLWLVNEAINNLMCENLNVFSPRHEIGLGIPHIVAPLDLDAIKSSKLVFAILDGMDPGTLYEIGYARSLNIPVIAYLNSEKKENLTMLLGSGCKIYYDFCTAIYNTIWEIYKK